MHLIDRNSYIFALAALLLSWILFFWETGQFFKSFFGAALAAGCAWITYVFLRWLILAIKGD